MGANHEIERKKQKERRRGKGIMKETYTVQAMRGEYRKSHHLLEKQPCRAVKNIHTMAEMPGSKSTPRVI